MLEIFLMLKICTGLVVREMEYAWFIRVTINPVSYTHLDVYKRQLSWPVVSSYFPFH